MKKRLPATENDFVMTKLRIARMRACLKQKDLAEKTGLTTSAISSLELRGIKSVRVAKLLAPHLNVKPEDIIEI